MTVKRYWKKLQKSKIKRGCGDVCAVDWFPKWRRRTWML